MMKKYPQIGFVVFLAFLSAGCGNANEDLAKHIAETYVKETAIAQSSQVLPSDTPEPLPTPTPLPPTDTLPPPTDTPSPEPTPTPGPFTYLDDFTSDTGNWGDCGICQWKNGRLHMGPAPVSGAGDEHLGICNACGMTRNYRMSVDITFLEGPAFLGRGYGLLLKLTEDKMLVFEINPWQTAELWEYDFDDHTWTLVTGAWTGQIRTGSKTNRISVEVRESGIAKSDIFLTVNGTTVAIAWGRASEPGFVGFALAGHAVEVMFDNFEFEELEPYQERITPIAPDSGSA
jgi:hypothetical protein